MKEQIELLIMQGKCDLAKDTISQHEKPNAVLLSQLSRIYELTGYFEQALQTAGVALNNSRTTSETFMSTIAYAYAAWRLFQFESALGKLTHLLQMNLEIHQKGDFYNIRGLIHWKRDELQLALQDFTDSLEYRRKSGNMNNVAYTLNNLGNTYLKMENYKQADNYFTDALEMRSELGYLPGLAASHNSFGRLFDAKGDFKQANNEYMESLALWQSVGNLQFIAKAYRFLAINASLRGDKQECVGYFLTSEDIFASIPNQTDLRITQEIKQRYL